jgi:putative phosphoesterase
VTTVAIFSDVHGNLNALQAVLADVRTGAVDRVYCLGDLVGYGPDPNGVIDTVREEGIPTIMGNYDEGVGFDLGHCGCFYPDSEAKRIGVSSYEFTSKTVTAERKTYLRELPRELRLEIDGMRVHLVHGSPRKINEYLLPTRDRRTYDRLAAAEESDVLVFGHTHRPWHKMYGNVLFVNVGSAGRPTDGDPRAAYTILRFGPGIPVEVEDVRVEYDVEGTAAAMLEVGLPAELAGILRRGG